MKPHQSVTLAWSIAIASLLLWATSAASTWGQSMSSQSDSTRTDDSDASTSTTGDSAPCPAGPEGVTPSTPAAAPGPDLSSGAATQQGSFHLCGPDAQVARAIEQLIAGRGFSASLSTQSDGCADLTIKTTSPVSNGRTSSAMKVSLGSGQSLSIQIVSEGGTTHVSIG